MIYFRACCDSCYFCSVGIIAFRLMLNHIVYLRTDVELISASKGNCKAVSLKRGAVRRADVTSDVCDQKCDGPTNAWVVQCLS